MSELVKSLNTMGIDINAYMVYGVVDIALPCCKQICH